MSRGFYVKRGVQACGHFDAKMIGPTDSMTREQAEAIESAFLAEMCEACNDPTHYTIFEGHVVSRQYVAAVKDGEVIHPPNGQAPWVTP